MTTRSGTPSSSRTRSTSSWASRSWITRVLPSRLARSMCRRNDSSWAARPSSPVRKWSSPVSPTARTRSLGAGQRLDLVERRLEPAGRGQPRRLVGVQRDAGDDRLVLRRGLDRPARAGQVAADLHDAGHPDGRGRRQGASSTLSSSSPSRVMSRWQWLSTTGCGSGSGAGGSVGSWSGSSALVHRVVHLALGQPGPLGDGVDGVLAGESPSPRPRRPARPASPRRWVRRRGRSAPPTTIVTSPRTPPPPRRPGRPARPGDLLVGLGELAAHRGGPVRAERLAIAASAAAVRCGASKKTIVRCSAASSASRRDRSPALRGRKPSKQNRSTGRPGDGERGEHRGGPGHGCDRQVALHRGGDQPVARVGDRRHARRR